MRENDALLLERTETWFVRRGLPFFIEDRRATDDVFTRALPILLAYFAGNMMVVLSPRVHISIHLKVAVAAAAFLVLLLLYGVRNAVNRERIASLPNRISWFEIAGFAVIPPVVDYFTRRSLRLAAIDFGLAVGVIAVSYLLTSALLPLARWAIKRTFQELGEVFDLAARALPLVFLFNSFLFISGDVWQFAAGDQMTRPRLWGIVGLFAVFTMLFLLYRLPDEVRRVAKHDDRSTIVEACRDTPMDGVVARVILHEGALPLSRVQRVNVLMVLFVGQMLQVVTLGFIVFVFFVIFGQLALTPGVINDWTKFIPETKDHSDPATVFNHQLSSYIGVNIDNRLWQVSLFLAAVSAFFFAISSMTDEAYKEAFYARMNRELETALQVRRVYLALYEDRHAVDTELSASGVHLLHVPEHLRQAEAMIERDILERERTVQEQFPRIRRHARDESDRTHG